MTSSHIDPGIGPKIDVDFWTAQCVGSKWRAAFVRPNGLKTLSSMTVLTQSRGLSKFDRVMSALPVLRDREDGAAWMRRLRQAALLDEQGIALDGALKTVATL